MDTPETSAMVTIRKVRTVVGVLIAPSRKKNYGTGG